MVDYVVTGQKVTPNINSFGVAVSGPNVTAASIVIPKCVTNPKMLTDYMKEVGRLCMWVCACLFFPKDITTMLQDVNDLCIVFVHVHSHLHYFVIIIIILISCSCRLHS